MMLLKNPAKNTMLQGLVVPQVFTIRSSGGPEARRRGQHGAGLAAHLRSHEGRIGANRYVGGDDWHTAAARVFDAGNDACAVGRGDDDGVVVTRQRDLVALRELRGSIERTIKWRDRGPHAAGGVTRTAVDGRVVDLRGHRAEPGYPNGPALGIFCRHLGRESLVGVVQCVERNVLGRIAAAGSTHNQTQRKRCQSGENLLFHKNLFSAKTAMTKNRLVKSHKQCAAQ
ncbi:MAG: hypothetical protein QM769_03045 [Pseudoxanthomonas sp.]